MTMTQSLCPECGSPLAANAPEGSCFTCLLMLGVVAPAADAASGVVKMSANMSPAGASPLTEYAGQRIGRYRLLEQIGEGGFGTVWMAEQEEPVRRKVALKILKLGMDTKQVVARFEAERQALAMMDHPSIARVFDGGTTENGRPYFVMELVKGVRITDYCDAARLRTEERLKLFIEICQAVQHAHQKGIIHRDLKPSNVLVTVQDDKPVPKVIDFGIAKATEQKLTEETLFTRFNQLIGTPAYMSPEQAGLGSLDIDTRSDIYALGVLLYELLTGRTPFSTEKLLKSGLDEVLRTIRENEPPRPSTSLSTLANEELLNTALRRGADPAKLSRQVRGELDWIVMKAMEKDRSRRYETANGLATDLRCHLEGKAVGAAPPTLRYWFGKFARKNRMAIATAMAFAALLVAGIVATTWQAVRATQQRARAEAGEASMRQSLYASEMNVAFRAWQEGRIVRARELLENQRPHPGETDLRGFEWRYLWKHSRATELFTLTNAATEWGVALSPDGQTVAACSGGQVGLWNVTTRKLISILEPEATGWLMSMAFSPDGRTLVTAHYDQRQARLWDVGNRTPIGHLETKEHLIGVAYSPDGKALVTTGGTLYQSNSASEVVIWDMTTKQRIHTLLGATSWVYQATFSPDGQTLAASGGDGAVTIWKVATGEMIMRLTGHHGFVEPITFSSDGEILAAGDEQGYVWLWNWRSRRVESLFRAHDRPIYTILFSPDEQRLITTSRDHTARMWDRKTLRETVRFAGHVGAVSVATLVPDGQTLVTSAQDGSIKLWDVRNQFLDNVLGTHTESDAPILFTSGGRFLARVERNKGQITFFHTETGAEVTVLSGQDASASRDGKLLCLVRDSKLIFLDPVSLVETGSMDAGAPLGSSAVSPDGKWIAVRRRDSAATNVVIIHAGQRREVTVFPTPDGEWAPLLFAREGTLLLTTGQGADTISAWDTRSWQKAATFQGKSRESAVLAVSPDGKTIAASTAASVLVWAMDHPSNPTLLNTGADQAYSLAFSPDGKTLAIGSIDSMIRLWNVAARQEVAVFVGHSSYVNSIAFAPDGRTLASVSLDNTLRVWRAPSFEEIAAAEKDRTRTCQP
jgi:eukaryotic-like serine/threonine-protein kinase